MAYRAPPGPSSLPSKPPPSSASGAYQHGPFRPAFGSSSAASVPDSSSTRYGTASSYAPQQQGQQYGTSSNQYSSAAKYQTPSYPAYPGSAAAAGLSAGSQPPSYPGQQQQPPAAQAYSAHAPGYHSTSSYSAPQIRNPFPLPGTEPAAAVGGIGFDPTEAAQIAEWQTAYGAAPQVGRDGKPLATTATASVEAPRPDADAAAANPDKKKTVARQGGGKSWTDDSLLEWDPSHMRIFVGNLAGETTDESLLKAFSRWKSVQKARVIRDKRSSKSKGYGFVSFSDADDFFQAAKEMNGKYIQSHPVVVKKANTEIKAVNAKDKNKQHNRNKQKNKSGNQASGANGGSYEPNLGPIGGGGVVKPGQKTKNGLRLLG
ncbi:RNP domain protein [Drechmeria coniospora]|uniref:RNP domain protein n=1 Tax=Drechmeria coniospora TaxID=98403 RepID=A0A151GEK1_DRECN|nr:RNP domain protein [Drechmeria coniospora]KYK55519.1 RNP domain protein [Drechmeria coniospora]